MSAHMHEHTDDGDSARENRLAELDRKLDERHRKEEADALLWRERIAASTYDQARTRLELNRLLRHGHIIPISRGITRAFIDQHYPGWTWNELIRVLKSADVVRGPGGSPPHCRASVGAVHFNRDGSWRVEWLDGHVTTSAG